MLSKDDISNLVERVNSALRDTDTTGELLLCGGAVMAWVYNARDATKDIDAAFTPTQQIRAIAASLAEEFNLDDDWLNDGAKGFLDTRLLDVEVIKEYSNLVVKSPDAESMLALKLASARPLSNDAADALFLMRHLGIKTRDELLCILERHIPAQRLTIQAQLFAETMYDMYSDSVEPCPSDVLGRPTSLRREGEDGRAASAAVDGRKGPAHEHMR